MSEELNNLTRPTKQNVTVLWSNRPQGTYCTDNHVLLDALAMVCEKSGAYYNVILFLRSPAKTMKEHEYAMGLILAHERAHVFGMSDAYIDANHERDGWVCVMEAYDGSSLDELRQFYFDVIWGEKDAFCDDCEEMLSYIRND